VHGKIFVWGVPQQHQAVSANAKFSITESLDQLVVFIGKVVACVIDKNKVIPGTLVF